jgi:L-alanine-DL-glutamate epimerase-like enolase superfamily enzyme
MSTFTFHGWVIVEIFTDSGLVGIGNAALSPTVTKQVIDQYLKPLLIGQDPWDIEFLWQHMYRKTMAFGRKGIVMVAISAVDIALWDILGKSAKQPVYRLLGGAPSRRSRCIRAACTALRSRSSRRRRPSTRRKATRR